MKTSLPLTLAALALLFASGAARAHSEKDLQADIQRHRAMAAAHEAAAKCLESGKGHDVCLKELQAACKSLAIGNPADGIYVLDICRRTGGAVEDITDDQVRDAIVLLARTEGIFTETAGGTTVVITGTGDKAKVELAETIAGGLCPRPCLRPSAQARRCP